MHFVLFQVTESEGVFTPIVCLLWSESGTNLLQCCMLPRVWFVFTRQHLQAEQNVWFARNLLFNWSEFRKRRSNSSEFSTEQTGNQAPKQRQYHIRLLFKSHALLLILRSGTLPAVVFYNTDLLASDHVIITGTPQPRNASCLPYCAKIILKMEPMGVTGRRSNIGSRRNAANTYHVEIRG